MYKVYLPPGDQVRKDYRESIERLKNCRKNEFVFNYSTECINTKPTSNIKNKENYQLLKFSDLTTYNVRYHNKKLVGWVVEEPYRISGTHTIIRMDREGKECVRICIYHIEPYLLQLGTKVTVYAPYFKLGTLDGKPSFRVDDLNTLELETDRSEQLRNQGNSYFGKKEYKKAIECYTTALKEDPNNHLIFNNRSTTYFMMKEFDNSYYDAKRVVELSDQWFKGYYRVSKALFELKRYMESYDFICKALLLDKDDTPDIKAHFEQLLKLRKVELNSSNPVKVVTPQFPDLTSNPVKINDTQIQNISTGSDSIGSSSSSSSQSKKNQQQSQSQLQSQPQSQTKSESQPKSQSGSQPKSQPESQLKSESQNNKNNSNSNKISIKAWKIIDNNQKIGNRYMSSGVDVGEYIFIWGGLSVQISFPFGTFNVGNDIDEAILYDTKRDRYLHSDITIPSRKHHSMVKVQDKIYIIGGTAISGRQKEQQQQQKQQHYQSTVVIKCLSNGSFSKVNFDETNKPPIKECNSVVIGNDIWVVDSDCNVFTLNTRNGNWSSNKASSSSSKPSKRTIKCLCTVGSKDRYILMYGGCNSNITKYKDLWCFDTFTSQWSQIIMPAKNQKGPIPSINSEIPNGFNSYTSNQGIKYGVLIDQDLKLWLLNTETLQWREVPYILPSPIPDIVNFQTNICGDQLYIIGGSGVGYHNQLQISDDIFSFPIGEVINSINEEQNNQLHDALNTPTMPLWSCFTCGNVTSKVCSTQCKSPVLYCSSKCKFKGLSKHECKEDATQDNETAYLNSLERDIKLLNLERLAIEEEIQSTSTPTNQKESLNNQINQINDKIKSTKLKIEDHKEARQCPICYDDESDYLLECGHAFCNGCLEGLSSCAICKTKITKKAIKMYI